jgi:hypothetical protein
MLICLKSKIQSTVPNIGNLIWNNFTGSKRMWKIPYGITSSGQLECARLNTVTSSVKWNMKIKDGELHKIKVNVGNQL